MRRFEEVSKEFRKFPDVETKLPERSTSRSAGYDFYSKEDYTLQPGESHTFWTDVKVAMFFDNVLAICARSGLGCKAGVVPRNCVGIIDADYFGNPENDGAVGICLVNSGEIPVQITVGAKIAQGIFLRYMIVDDDRFLSQKTDRIERIGGFGSTGR